LGRQYELSGRIDEKAEPMTDSEKGLMQEHLVDDLAVKENSYWWHKIRRNNLIGGLKKYLPNGGEVLEIGCGTGANLREIRKRGYAVRGLELDSRAITYCKDLEVLQADATQTLPYQDNSFEAVCLLDVLEHLDEPEKVVLEIWRILKPGGLVVVMVPADPNLWSYWDEMLGHYRRYTKKTLNESFDKNWKMLDLRYFFSWMYLPVKIFRRFKKDRVGDKHSDFVPLWGWLNYLLVLCGKIENVFQNLAKVPVGTTVAGFWKKVEVGESS
jgi:SAM-dependent methyltransferase